MRKINLKLNEISSNNKILFVSNSLGGGGAQRVLTVLANEFCRQGYAVTIAYYVEGERYYIDPKIECIYLDCRSRIEQIFKLRSLLKKKLPKAIIAFEYFVNMKTLLAKVGIQCKCIVSERNDPSVRGGKFPIKIIRNFLYNKADNLVCQTPDAMNYFPQRIKNHTIVIANPLKSGLPLPWTGNRENRVVNFCRLTKQKNLPLLLDAFDEFHKKHEDFVLEIYGDGPERNSLEEIIEKKNLAKSVFLKDASSDIHNLVLNAGMFVSSSDYEGLSNSMIEAMAIGLPTISTDCPCGGAKMIIQNDVNGLLVLVNNKYDMVSAMEKIASDDEFAKKLSVEGAKVREKLSLEFIFTQWEKLIL